ncbi:MAG TPA: YjgP/YjgQ family permease [Crocinitomicaceae bacterium]|nr:YjgP/YjgQ family permease [Crocinitomicaceae bacterium]
MLKIIDKYIIKKFLTTFFFMMGVIMILAMVFDIAEKLGEFIENDATFYEVVVEYYINFILFYGNMFSSMIIFVSVIWFTAKMAQDTEIIPIWNSGRKFGRFVRPYMIAATLLMLTSLAFNHFIIPHSNKVRLSFEDKFYRNTISVQDYHAEFPNNEIVYFKSYNGENNTVTNFTIEKWNGKGELVSFIKAGSAVNIPGEKKWVLNNYYQRIVGYPNDKIIQGPTTDTTFQFSIDEMATRENIAEAMDYFALREFIQREREKGSTMVPTYEIELYQRSSYPFATYILTIIGVAVASRKKRGGVGINIAIGLLIIFIYIFAMKVTTVAAINVGLPAYFAVWVPNILFAGVAYLLYRKAKA